MSPNQELAKSEQAPAITVIVVSDFEASAVKTWQDERQALRALARQDIDEPFDVLLVEHGRARGSVPADLEGLCRRTRILFCDAEQSDRMKDFGVGHCTSPYIAVMEADCLPNSCWLRVLVAGLRAHPKYAVASGRTTYGHESAWKRACSVLDRTFDDLGRSGETAHISNNGALYRGETLKKYPYPAAGSPFTSARLRLRQMKAAGIRCYFEPTATMRHGIGGLEFVRDFRRHTGYSDVVFWEGEARLRLVPRLLYGRWRQELADCLRLGPKYLKWYDWPLLGCLWLAAPFLQLPGVLDALRGGPIANSAYR